MFVRRKGKDGVTAGGGPMLPQRAMVLHRCRSASVSASLMGEFRLFGIGVDVKMTSVEFDSASAAGFGGEGSEL